jgi:hypothetical protein
MWIPATEHEILAAIEAGDLIETASFDAKEALPDKGKSKDLAVDVAAMSADGGTLLYGVGEDDNDRLTVPQPFELAGARERVDQIVRSTISEPPAIEVYTIPTDDDPSLGYLVVHVPASPRAPHMVIVGGKEYRYYGRGATGNVLLTEGEVARLYERWQRWEVDRGAALDEAIASAPIPPHEDFAYLHLVARPVVPNGDLFDKASNGQPGMQFLGGLISAASSAVAFPTRYSPDLSGSYSYEQHADGWVVNWGLGVEWEEREDPSRVLELEVGLDGSGRIFCGRAAHRHREQPLIFEPLMAGLTAKFLAVMGSLYDAGAYLGPVDVGVAVTGLKGSVSYVLDRDPWADPRPYIKDRYRRTERLLASQLVDDPRAAARKLVLPLLRAISRESYDPFAE